MKPTDISIVKMSGKKARFEQGKLRKSLERTGASDIVIDEIIREIESRLYQGISTKEIYKTAFGLLRKSSRPTAARYKLKKAIMELGPSGFPFEKFIGEILHHQGFKTSVGVKIKGHCVEHEVDVAAEKEALRLMVECKYHSDQSRHCDVKIPLYIQSRFLDIERQWRKDDGEHKMDYQGWVFTNTRFTTDAIQYGNCMGLVLIGWDQPRKGSLKERIDISGLHPITCLTTISNYEKKRLLEQQIVLCKDLCNNADLLKSIGISEKRHKRVLKEVHELCVV